jgi:phage gp29-like protein
MGAPSKRAKKTRAASEFDTVRLAAELRPPKQSIGLHAWDLDAIRAARDAQMRGDFRQAARLVKATRTDYAIFASFLNRLAPQAGLPIELKAPVDSARAKKVLVEAEALFGTNGIAIHPDTLADIDGTLANHGVAFGVNVLTPREDGTRVDIEHKAWPIEYVRWDSDLRAFRTQVEGYEEETIVHGQGRWVIYQQHEVEPWTYGAIIAVALLWADHAFGVRDRAKASNTHGNAKVIGTMPQGVALQDGEGRLTPEAAAFMELLRAVASADTPVGVKPFGSLLDYLTNNSTAWQIFKEIIDSGDKAADRVYLGHDINVSSAGGDAVGYLFGVRNDIVEGSLKAIQRGIKTGVIDIWAAVNFGDSSLAPERVFMMPDHDEDARRKSLAERHNAFHETLEKARRNQFDVTQEYVDDLAKGYGVTAPKLKVSIPIPPAVDATQSSPTPTPVPANGAPPKLAAVP